MPRRPRPAQGPRPRARRDLPVEQAAPGHPEAHRQVRRRRLRLRQHRARDRRSIRTKKVVDVTYRIDEGPEVTIDKIEITGNTKTRDKVIRRELKVEEQQRFSGTKLKKSRDALQSPRLLLRRSTSRPSAGAARRSSNLLVDVKEGQTGALTAGAGFSSADNLLFNARISENNLFGRGQRAVLNADFGSIRQNFIASFTEPYLFDIPLRRRSTGSAGVSSSTTSPAAAPAAASRLLVSARPSSATIASPVASRSRRCASAPSTGWRRPRSSNINRRSPPSVVAEEGTSLTSSHPSDHLAQHAEQPVRSDARLDRGIVGRVRRARRREQLRQGRSTGAVRTGRSTSRTRSARSSTRSAARSATATAIAATAATSSRSSSATSPAASTPSAASRPGRSARASRSATRRARTCNSDPIGGSRQLIVNNEIIFPIVEQLGLKGVVFFDAGNAWLDSDGYDFGDLRYAAGAGLRWQSPLGPIRIELGYPAEQAQAREGEPRPLLVRRTALDRPQRHRNADRRQVA